MLLPNGLPVEFTAKDYDRILGLNAIESHNSLKLLLKLGVLSRNKGSGRAYIYTINDKI